MSHPRAFLSFAGADRPAAKLLEECLNAGGVGTFLDEQDIEPGQNIIRTVDDALGQADWFVLLWSHHTVGNPFVELEWTTALMRDLAARRSFLFVVKLDETALPPVLTPRSWVEFRGDWNAVANRFLPTWGRDRSIGLPVLPAPGPAVPGIEVYVRNGDLRVAHVVPVPAATTGRGLMDTVRKSLKLKDEVTEFDGQVGSRFFYRLEHEGRPVTANVTLPAGPGFAVDLLIRVEWFGPKFIGNRVDYRNDDQDVLNQSMKQQLITLAFGHLTPDFHSAELTREFERGNGDMSAR